MLASSVAHSAKNTDPKLLNPFDLVWDECSIWVTSKGSSEVIQYNSCGERQTAVNVPTPTGICIGKSEQSKCGKNKCVKTVYVASSGGSVYILGGAPPASPTTASSGPQVHVTPGGVLAGIAWHKGKLYVAAYDAGYVGAYNGTTLELAIKDDALMAVGYKPYGVRCLEGLIYITYTNMSIRQGAGYVNVYDPKCGGGLRRIINRSNLSVSYGMFLQEDQLNVANSGTGYISIFSRDEYCYTHNVRNSSGGDVVLDGIMGITQVKEKLYFVMSSDSGKVGSLGVMIP